MNIFYHFRSFMPLILHVFFLPLSFSASELSFFTCYPISLSFCSFFFILFYFRYLRLHILNWPIFKFANFSFVQLIAVVDTSWYFFFFPSLKLFEFNASVSISLLKKKLHLFFCYFLFGTSFLWYPFIFQTLFPLVLSTYL